MDQQPQIQEKKIRGLPGKLKAGIDAGAKKTMSEWGEEFGKTYENIRQALTYLRQYHGQHQYHPVGTKSGFGKGASQGVVVDIYKHKEHVVETMGKSKTVYLDPQLIAFSSWLENGYRKYPELRQVFKAYLSDEISKLTILDEQLKISANNQ